MYSFTPTEEQQMLLDAVKRYAEGDFRVELEGKGERVRLEYLDYDWSLNEP